MPHSPVHVLWLDPALLVFPVIRSQRAPLVVGTDAGLGAAMGAGVGVGVGFYYTAVAAGHSEVHPERAADPEQHPDKSPPRAEAAHLLLPLHCEGQ